jgi:hypothetical protein
MAQLHFEAVVRQDPGGLVGPFDCNDGCSGEVIIESNSLRVFPRAEPVQIEMGQGKPTAIFMQEDEGWTADGIRRRAKTCGNASDKHGFACSHGP